MITDDAGAMLRDQLGEPRNYVAVVESIASGFTRMIEIAAMAGLQHSGVGKYLSVLQHLGIVARDVPATARRPEQSKQGRYRITDHYLRFYYRFIAQQRNNLELGLTQQACRISRSTCRSSWVSTSSRNCVASGCCARETPGGCRSYLAG
jgi:AAA+ ATPase superfamily predicted ATPase